MQLTNEQRDLADANNELIYAFLAQHKLPRDDYYGVAAIGLCYAAATYQPEKGKFSTYAYKAMLNEIRKALLHEKRKHWGQESSLNEQAYEDEDTTCMELLESPSTSPEDLAIASCALDWLKEHRPKEYAAYNLYSEGYTQREIAQIIGTAQQTVCNLLKRAKKSLYAQIEGENDDKTTGQPAL